RVVHMYSNARQRNLLELAVSAPPFQHYRDSQTIFDGFGAENVFAFTLTGLGDPVQIFGGRVTPSYFDVLGVRPIRGRNFLPVEEETADVAMVTENFWQKRMGGDANVIGRSVTLDGVVELYRPWAQENFSFLSIHLRSNLKTERVTTLVRSALATVDPGLAIALPQSMNTIVAQVVG